MSIDTLRRQRIYLKGKLTQIKNFINKVNQDANATPDEVTPEEVTARLQAVEEIYAKSQNISQQLFMLEDESDSRDEEEDAEFDDRYYSIKAELLQLLKRFKSPPARPSDSGASGVTNDATMKQFLEQQVILIQKLTERNDNDTLVRTMEQQGQLLERLSTRSNTSVREAQVKLPLIKLPTFDGNVEDWKRYSDTFKTLIHDSELSGVQKHQYLVGSLSGSAARIIEAIDISEDNYVIAWELLKKRYDDGRGIKRRHIQCLMDELPKIKQESASAIQELVDHVQKHIRVLQSMTLPTDSWRDLVIYLIEKNLDSATRKRWEEYIEDKEDVTTTTMMEFLQRQSQLLRRSAADGGTNGTRAEVCEKKASNKQLGSTTKLRGKTTLATTTQEKRCYLCQGQHLIYNCKTFLSLAVEDRIKEIRRLRLCLNCFRSDHYSRSCRYGSCKECGERHNTLCHLKEQARNPSTRPPRSPTENPEESSTGTTLCSVTDAVRGAATGDIESSGHRIRNDRERKRVLMATAIVNVKTSTGESQLRVLLDSASELNFVTATACKRLNIKLEPSRENISGLNGMSCVITHGCKISLRSRTSSFELNSYCLVVPRITKKLPSFTVEASELQLRIPDNLKLADPLYFSPGHIDALIGSEFFLQLLDNGKIELGDDLLALQNTRFGWVIAGPVPQHLIAGRADKDQLSSNHTCLLTQQVPLDETLKTFWELEEYKNNSTLLSRDEERCENYFVNTTSRDVASGRFVVRLPFRENRDQLGRSRNVAMKRFSHLERKLQGNLEFRDQYIEFMREYVDLGHMSAVDGGDVASNPIYLPHHGVIRKTSLTTKLRVVFDASARTTSGLSLNDTLLVGSKLQDNIIDIVMRFRLPAIAVTADLQKMYRQILIHPNDRDFQRILWRFSPSDPITEYKLNTVTYGQACAPFLAIRCVRQLAEEGASEFSEASKVLLNDLYVDDIITGVNPQTTV